MHKLSAQVTGMTKKTDNPLPGLANAIKILFATRRVKIHELDTASTHSETMGKLQQATPDEIRTNKKQHGRG